MSCDWARARSEIRSYTRPGLTRVQPPRPFPRPELRWIGVIASAVAMRDFEGTQSVSTQAPPSPSESTTVTSAPSCAATNAAS